MDLALIILVMIVNMADNPFHLLLYKCKYCICEEKISFRNNLNRKCVNHPVVGHSLLCSVKICEYSDRFFEINM